MASPAARLRALLEEPGCHPMPCCFDALSARLVERAGFRLTFMSGFSVSAARFGLPDAGLVSYAEMRDHGRDLCGAVGIPVIGDADTGYGSAMNARRTAWGYAAAGFACVMIEDQVWPKRCGHTAGKQVVDRDEALARVRAAVDAREAGADVLVLARTDARATHGIDEALWRARAFREAGADLLFVEAPQSLEELDRVPAEVDAPCMANLVEEGETPLLPPEELGAMGYRIAAYPLTLLSAATRAMQRALEALRAGAPPGPEARVSFQELQELAGFPEYDAARRRYASRS